MHQDPALARARWFKATASSGNQGCVEIAHLDDGRVALRDSKNPHAPAHLFTPTNGTACCTAPKTVNSTLPQPVKN